MKPEQLKWTEEQWAAHLGCAAIDVPKFKKYLEENYFIGIFVDRNTGRKFVEVQKRHDTPSGSIRYNTMASTQPRVASAEAMVNYANNEVIPSLVLSAKAAEIWGVPPKILQMLHIDEKQK